ncbi:MAG: stage III sporulation AC/AD family protein [Oscillospiraceae bacterium]|nr:stage III sporulation AC/AD family protein [Oscillospiraceae bacterium]
MDFIKIALIIFFSIILINTIPAYDKPVKTVIAIMATVIVILYIINWASPIIYSIRTVFQNNIDIDYEIIFKSMGISLITQFVADIAIDNGNKALANQMIFAGKAAIIALALPLFTQVLEIIGQLII